MKSDFFFSLFEWHRRRYLYNHSQNTKQQIETHLFWWKIIYPFNCQHIWMCVCVCVFGLYTDTLYGKYTWQVESSQRHCTFNFFVNLSRIDSLHNFRYWNFICNLLRRFVQKRTMDSFVTTVCVYFTVISLVQRPCSAQLPCCCCWLLLLHF